MKLLPYLFILFAFVACQEAEETPVQAPETVEEDYSPIIIENSIASKIHRFMKEENNPSWLSTAQYDFLYIGPAKDTITANPSMVFRKWTPPNPNDKHATSTYEDTEFSKYYLDWESMKHYRSINKSKVRIKVMTDTIFGDSYSAIVINEDSVTIEVGYGDHTPLIMEAKDSAGVWRPIEKRFIYLCGNGVGTIILPPGEIMLTSVPLFQGEYKTQLRLRYPNTEFYSNSFEGNINYRQFKSMFNDEGDYCDEYKAEHGIPTSD